MEFIINTTSLEANMQRFTAGTTAALKTYGETAAKKLESEAKNNRPWTDRTNAARRGLTGSSEISGDEVRIVLAHTVDYGVWLELAHQKNWAVVEPTVRMESNAVFQGLQGLFDKLRL